FMMEETFDFIRDFARRASSHGLQVLVEIHAHHLLQMQIARHVDWVYDFALPPLILHAFFAGTARELNHWIRIRPSNALTVLDTHDGIGVIDIAADSHDPANLRGLVSDAAIERLVQQIHANSHGQSLRATGAAASNLDLYQVNCTFYDALGRDDLRYLLARAIQFFLPGIPQVYYVGLLAGTNDMALLERSGVGRDINRHHYTRAEVLDAMTRPVVADLFTLMKVRNSHPAFHGRFELIESAGPNASGSAETLLDLRWHHEGASARLQIDLQTAEHVLELSGDGPVPQFSLLNVRVAGPQPAPLL